MGVRSKQKGAGFERFISESLSRWVSGGKRSDLFWRSSQSGGRATIAKKTKKQLAAQAGDICAIGDDPGAFAFTGRFYVECKSYKSLWLHTLLYYPKVKGKLLPIWEKTVAEATAYSKQPLLIAKENHRPAFILFDLRLRPSILPTGVCTVHTTDPPVFICVLDEFVRCVDPFVFIREGERLNENSNYSRPTPVRQGKRRLSLDVSELAVYTESGCAGDSG